ncbi:hypothetical protein ASPTUDRAFT_53347 [Aspergillus tubingensis CBS 134.48]|uniref:Uncharacterized protein n=1 Tax=Aspergillus tubingensis (strain CBS 134.48) TaxID=767770 RepID=A0A1L9N9R9_ASPTC|nr:hypothetical protein ASPTUDRAFT_53347 [Aspergillus tubingensis CBS 134.48]
MRQQRVTGVMDMRREQWNRQARVKRAAAAAPPEERAPVLFVSSLDAGATHATPFCLNSSRSCIPVVCYAGHGISLVDLNPSIPQSVVVTPTLAAKVRKRRSPYLFHTRPFSC